MGSRRFDCRSNNPLRDGDGSGDTGNLNVIRILGIAEGGGVGTEGISGAVVADAALEPVVKWL